MPRSCVNARAALMLPVSGRRTLIVGVSWVLGNNISTGFGLIGGGFDQIACLALNLDSTHSAAFGFDQTWLVLPKLVEFAQISARLV